MPRPDVYRGGAFCPQMIKNERRYPFGCADSEVWAGLVYLDVMDGYSSYLLAAQRCKIELIKKRQLSGFLYLLILNYKQT